MHRIRIAILADVHANLPALTAVLADAREHGCERIYHAGDLIGIGPYPGARLHPRGLLWCMMRWRISDGPGGMYAAE